MENGYAKIAYATCHDREAQFFLDGAKLLLIHFD